MAAALDQAPCHRLLSLLAPHPQTFSPLLLLVQNEPPAAYGEIEIIAAAFLCPPTPCFWGCWMPSYYCPLQ